MMDKNKIISLLETSGTQQQDLRKRALEIKIQNIGNGVRLRGLIEFSNRCEKNCHYCGIRAANKFPVRYELTDEEVMQAAKSAAKLNLGSVALQSGEQKNQAFIERVERLIYRIKTEITPELGITLSCGEQTSETYRRWFRAGAHRYLLRIETSNPKHYQQLHPANHRYSQRVEALRNLKNEGYMTGSGVMIGLPRQRMEDLADDLMFLKNLEVDMIGMGPFIPDEQTPLWNEIDHFWTLEKRVETTLNMTATARLMMPNINIVATTALQALRENGREQAIASGANVMMPNLTPERGRKNYQIYPQKPQSQEGTHAELEMLQNSLSKIKHHIIYGEWGDAPHYLRRKNAPENTQKNEIQSPA